MVCASIVARVRMPHQVLQWRAGLAWRRRYYYPLPYCYPPITAQLELKTSINLHTHLKNNKKTKSRGNPVIYIYILLPCFLLHFFSTRRETRREFVQGVRAGDGTLEDFLTTALSELCKVKPEGLDAVR